jgi:arabinoxylan arabinofuranohydrolase
MDAWVRLASGSDNGVVITLKITDSSGTKYYSTSPTRIGTSWTRVAKTVSVTITGTVSEAIFYVQTASSRVNMYVDDCSLRKM